MFRRSEAGRGFLLAIGYPLERRQNPARSVLEQMYSTGRLVIHHKRGSRKYYDIAEKHIPAGLLYAPEPLPDELEHFKWRILRRIGAVGLYGTGLPMHG